MWTLGKGHATVFGAGAAHPKIMFVGEQPGHQEDLEGKPFAGPAGNPILGSTSGASNPFFKLLTRDTQRATALARRHDRWMKGRVCLRADAQASLRHALEIRHDSFRAKAFIELLRASEVALVCADTVRWPRLMDVTSDFVYCRLHRLTSTLRWRL